MSRFQLSFRFCLLLQAFIVISIVNAQTRAIAPRISEAADDSRLVRLRGNTHPLARPEFDQGAAPPSLPMERMHLQVNHVSKGRTVVEFSGTAGQVLDAFHTEIHKFVIDGKDHWANTTDPQIPVTLEPVVAGVARLHNFRAKSMIEVSGKSPRVAPQSGFQPQYNLPDGTHALTPADYAVIYNINPLYKAGINGSGVTIGVLGRAPIRVQDIDDFRRAFNLPKNSPQVILNGTSPDNWQFDPGDDLEATLDVTWAGAVAPNATVKFITSPFTDTSDGLTLSEEYAIDNNVADVLTESFGLCEHDITQADAQMVNALRQQAAAQGITYVVSSGDEGPYTCYSTPKDTGPLSVNVLASSPYAVAVGGTEFSGAIIATNYWAATNKTSTLASALSYIPETAWNDSCSAAQCGADGLTVGSSGGGVSKLYIKPSWQSGVLGVPADGMRDVPDISLAASAVDAPYLLCDEGSCKNSPVSSSSFMQIGGTSASAPSFAGVMALVIQKTKSRQGQANYSLYRLAASQQYSKCNGSNPKTLPDSSCIFNDITAGNNAVPGEPKYSQPGALYQAGVGYDLATGLGSANVTNLVNRWSSATFNSTQTSLTVNPTTLTHGDAASVEIAVTSQSGTGGPTGDVFLAAAHGPGAGRFSLTNGSVTSTTAALPGGTYTVHAHYAGDGTFAAAEAVVWLRW